MTSQRTWLKFAGILLVPQTAFGQMGQLSVLPTLGLEGHFTLFDSATKSDIGLAASSVNLGADVIYKDWLARLEIETKGPGHSGESGLTNVRQAFIERKFGLFSAGLGRMLPSSAFTTGRYFTHNAIEDEYGGFNGLRLQIPVADSKEGFRWGVAAAAADSLGTTPVSEMQVSGVAFTNLYNPSRAHGQKDGLAWILDTTFAYDDLKLNVWYGSEKNRFASAATTGATAAAPDGVVYKNYSDLQTTLSYAPSDWAAYIGYRQITRSKSLKGLVELNGHVVTSDVGASKDSQKRDLIAIGGEYTLSRNGDERWVLGFDAMQATTATDDLTPTAESLEDKNDTKLYALTQSYFDGPFEVAAKLYYARASGDVFSDKDGKAGAKNNRTIGMLSVILNLGDSRSRLAPAAAEKPPVVAAIPVPPPPPAAAPVPEPKAPAPAAAPATPPAIAFNANAVQFELSSSRLSGNSKEFLVQIGQRLSKELTLWDSLEIIGHTDGTGPKHLNDRLSSERAASVRAALIEGGVPGNRLKSRGLGASEPLPNIAPEASEQRRVEFRFKGIKDDQRLQGLMKP